MAALLQLAEITLMLGRSAVLCGVDLAVRAGEIHALIGVNGCGKSSLALMVMGCQGYAASGGKLLFAGDDIADWSISRRARAGISLAWQEPTRFEGLSVADYLHLDPAWARPDACLEAVGLDPAAYLPRMVDKGLSGGERKRIELAAMLAMRPKLAILDEPAASVDVLSLREVTAAILTLRRIGSSVLLITHQEEVAACADRASHLCGGRIACSGSPAAVAENYRGRVRDPRVCGHA